MNKVQDRIKFWKKLSQQTTGTFDLRSNPYFKPNLFANRPDILFDLNKIASIINKYMLAVSNNKINFSLTWTNPSVDQSAFSNSLKNLYSLAKWLMGLVTRTSPPYSIENLRKIATDLSTTIQQYDFPEPIVSNVKSEIIAATQDIVNKLSGANAINT